MMSCHQRIKDVWYFTTGITSGHGKNHPVTSERATPANQHQFIRVFVLRLLPLFSLIVCLCSRGREQRVFNSSKISNGRFATDRWVPFVTMQSLGASFCSSVLLLLPPRAPKSHTHSLSSFVGERSSMHCCCCRTYRTSHIASSVEERFDAAAAAASLKRKERTIRGMNVHLFGQPRSLGTSHATGCTDDWLRQYQRCLNGNITVAENNYTGRSTAGAAAAMWAAAAVQSAVSYDRDL